MSSAVLVERRGLILSADRIGHTRKRPPRRCHDRGTGRHPLGGISMGEGTCSVEDCERPHFAKGLCKRHYSTWRYQNRDRPHCIVEACDRPRYCRQRCTRHYHLWRKWRTHEMPVKRTVAERLWAKFKKTPNGCWVWQATKSNGYGHITIRSRSDKPLLAHRVMYELIVGPIPDGLHLDHLCRNRACVNPMHLEPVTVAENQRRGLSGVLKTHCKHGHPWVARNLRTTRGGRVVCRPCEEIVNERRRKRRAPQT